MLADSGVPMACTWRIQTSVSRSSRLRRWYRCSPSGAGMRTKGCFRHAPQHLSHLGAHGQHRLHEKSPSAFVANVPHSADLVPMGQIDVGRILHQQHHGRGGGLFPGLLKVRLHQRRKGDRLLCPPSLPGCHQTACKAPAKRRLRDWRTWQDSNPQPLE